MWMLFRFIVHKSRILIRLLLPAIAILMHIKQTEFKGLNYTHIARLRIINSLVRIVWTCLDIQHTNWQCRELGNCFKGFAIELICIQIHMQWARPNNRILWSVLNVRINTNHSRFGELVLRFNEFAESMNEFDILCNRKLDLGWFGCEDECRCNPHTLSLSTAFLHREIRPITQTTNSSGRIHAIVQFGPRSNEETRELALAILFESFLLLQ